MSLPVSMKHLNIVWSRSDKNMLTKQIFSLIFQDEVGLTKTGCLMVASPFFHSGMVPCALRPVNTKLDLSTCRSVGCSQKGVVNTKPAQVWGGPKRWLCQRLHSQGYMKWRFHSQGYMKWRFHSQGYMKASFTGLYEGFIHRAVWRLHSQGCMKWRLYSQGFMKWRLYPQGYMKASFTGILRLHSQGYMKQSPILNLHNHTLKTSKNKPHINRLVES